MVLTVDVLVVSQHILVQNVTRMSGLLKEFVARRNALGEGELLSLRVL